MTDETPGKPRHELWEMLDKLQMDIRSASVKLVEIRAKVAGLDLPEPSHEKCSHCGAKFPGIRTLSEHLYISHDGPEPDHWKDPPPAAVTEAA